MKPFYSKVIIFIIILVCYSNSNYCQNSVNSKDSYTVKIDKNSPKKVFIECDLEIRDSLLYMSNYGAGQFPSGWAHFVHDLKVKSPEGQLIKLDSLNGAQWRIHSPDRSKVNVSYSVYLDHENYQWSGGVDGAAYATDWGVFFTGRSLFLMSGREKEQLQVNFEIAQEWKVSTPWEPYDENKRSYLVSNQTALSNGMFFAGTHEEKIIKRDDFELIFAFGGEEMIKQKQSYTAMAEGVLDYYIGLMGGVPNPSPDNKFKRSIVVMNNSSQTDGEVIGNNISILLQKDGDAMSNLMARFIFAHEFFHLWNGKSFIPQEDNCEWFKEGFSNYYTLKALFHIGFLNEEACLDILNNFFYQRYHNDKGVGEISLIQGDQKHDHWGVIYSGGFFAGIAQDMIIRNSTKNNKSIDDVMRTLFKKYGGTNDRYTLEELKELMSKTSGADQTEFFNSFVEGNKRIPLDHYMKMGGFNAQEADGKIRVSIKDDRNSMEENLNNGFFGRN